PEPRTLPKGGPPSRKALAKTGSAGGGSSASSLDFLRSPRAAPASGQIHLGTRVGELLLDLLGLGLVDAFLDLAASLDQILGFLQAKAGDRAHFLDHVDLV